ncbi:DJ-1/PfpI family protein, partial [Pseudomonas neuropathica]
RMANMAAREPMFRTVIIAASLDPVTASNGMRILPDYTITDAPRLDILFVVGSNPIVSNHSSRPLLNWLRKLAHDQVPLGGICTGSH